MKYPLGQLRASCPYSQPHPGSLLNQWACQTLNIKRMKKKKKKRFREKSVILTERLELK